MTDLIITASLLAVIACNLAVIILGAGKSASRTHAIRTAENVVEMQRRRVRGSLIDVRA